MKETQADLFAPDAVPFNLAGEQAPSSDPDKEGQARAKAAHEYATPRLRLQVSRVREYLCGCKYLSEHGSNINRACPACRREACTQ